MTYEPPTASPDPYFEQFDPQGPGGGLQPPQPNTVPRKRQRWGLIIGIVAGVLVLCCGGMVTLGLIVGPPKNTASVTSAEKAATAAATSKPPATSPSPSPKPSPTPSPSKPAANPTTAAPTTAAPPNYAAAAAILLADDEHYRQEIAAGPPVLGTPQFTAWWQKASTDTQNMDDFGKADAYFTADNEPTGVIEAWRTDNGNATSDVYQFAAAELAAGPGPATADMHTWEVAFQADIEKADADARQIQTMQR